MRNFRQLHIWQRSQAVAVAVAHLDDRRARHRAPGLMTQLRRAAMSIPANIAEGCGHDSQLEFVRFLGIAVASAVELESHLLMARSTGAIPPTRADALINETVSVRRMCDRMRAVIRRGETDRGSDPVQ